MFHWGKKKSFGTPVPVDPNGQITPEETAQVLRLAELVPLVPPRQILLLLRESSGSADGCIEKLLAMQIQMEQEQAAEKRLLEESAANLSNSKAAAVQVPQSIQASPSAPVLDEEKINAVKKVTEQLAALERTYESSFQVMENKLRDLQTENEAQRAEIALLHQQLEEKDEELKQVRQEMKRPPASSVVADEVMKDVMKRFEDAYISAFSDGNQADELVRSFGQLLRRKLALELLKGTGEISEKDFVKLEREPAEPVARPPPPVVPSPAFGIVHPERHAPFPGPHHPFPIAPMPQGHPHPVFVPPPGMPHGPVVYPAMMPLHLQPHQQQRHSRHPSGSNDSSSQAF